MLILLVTTGNCHFIDKYVSLKFRNNTSSILLVLTECSLKLSIGPISHTVFFLIQNAWLLSFWSAVASFSNTPLLDDWLSIYVSLFIQKAQNIGGNHIQRTGQWDHENDKNNHDDDDVVVRIMADTRGIGGGGGSPKKWNLKALFTRRAVKGQFPTIICNYIIVIYN